MLTENELIEGNQYSISKNNIQIGIYTYMGTKSAVNDKSKMARFVMFMKYEKTSNDECIEGYEVSDSGFLEPDITINTRNATFQKV